MNPDKTQSYTELVTTIRERSDPWQKPESILVKTISDGVRHHSHYMLGGTTPLKLSDETAQVLERISGICAGIASKISQATMNLDHEERVKHTRLLTQRILGCPITTPKGMEIEPRSFDYYGTKYKV